MHAVLSMQARASSRCIRDAQHDQPMGRSVDQVILGTCTLLQRSRYLQHDSNHLIVAVGTLIPSVKVA